MRVAGAVVAATASGLVPAPSAAHAQATIRLGKPQANQFAFAPVDVGVDTGIFKKHGIDLKISVFGGDAKLMQALAAGGIDIALGGCPAFADIAKGAPMKAVAADADAPNIIMLVVLKDGPIKTVGDLKGRAVSVSTPGSLTFWLTQQLSRLQGWGDDGIKITPLGSSRTQIAALMTRQVDGVTTDSITVENFVATGRGRVLVKFGDYIKDFHSGCVFASNALIASDPKALRAFLAGWFEAVAFMRNHRQATIDIAVRHTGISAAVTGAIYDDTMPVMNRTGHFNPKALDVLATSFVETHALPSKPDMSKLLTEAFLPK
jgi:NitT/TauT family transport system substrate-binding protein